MSKAAKLFLTLFMTCAFFTNTYLTTNDASRFSMTAAIVETHSLEITRILPIVLPQRGEGWVARDYMDLGGRGVNRVYSDKAPAGAIIAVPVYYIVTKFTRRLPIIIYFVSLFTVGLMTALTGVMLFKLGRVFGCAELQSLLVGLVYGLASMALFYGGIFFSGAITAFFLFAAFYLLNTEKIGAAARNARALAGVFMALAIMSDYYAVIGAAALLLYAVAGPSKKIGGVEEAASTNNDHKKFSSLSRFAAPLGFFLTIPLLFLYNYNLLGNPFDTGYHHSLLAPALHEKGFYGIVAPSLDGLKRLYFTLFTMNKEWWGFFITNMPVLFSIAYFHKFAKFRREAALIIFMTAGYLYLNTSLGWNDAYSARFFMPALPFLFLPMLTLPLAWKPLRSLFFFIAGFSMMINFIGSDLFMPQIKSLARPGMQNLFGAWLASQGSYSGYFSFIPIFIVLIFIWLLPLPDKHIGR